MFNIVYFFTFSDSICPRIIDEQEAFIRRVLKIPFNKRKCKDLITLGTLHAYCGGPVPMPTARKINIYSHRCKFLFLCLLLGVILFLFAYLTSVSYPLQKWRQRGKEL